MTVVVRVVDGAKLSTLPNSDGTTSDYVVVGWTVDSVPLYEDVLVTC